MKLPVCGHTCLVLAICCTHPCCNGAHCPAPNPCSDYVATVQRFVETRRAYEWGLVCQALAGAMRHVLQVRWGLVPRPQAGLCRMQFFLSPLLSVHHPSALRLALRLFPPARTGS